MDFVRLISIVSGIVGIISAIVGFVFYIKGIWRYIYYWIFVKIFNRKPMNLQLSLTNKYNEKPSKKFTSEIFKKIKNDFDKNTEDIKRSALRPESIKIMILNKVDNLTYYLTLRLDEEPKLETLNNEINEILHYNLIIKLASELRLNWYDLKYLKDLALYFDKIESRLKKETFNDSTPTQYFFTCYIYRDFFIKKEPKIYTEKNMKASISIKKKEIYIKGSNLQYLNELIKKYYLRRI